LKRENIEAFIDYGINKELTAVQLKNMVFGMSIYYIIGIFYGLMLGGIARVFGLLILIVTLISTIIILLKSKELSIKNYCIVFGTFSLQLSINFLLITLILVQMLETIICFIIAL
jgi:hypothetical protein